MQWGQPWGQQLWGAIASADLEAVIHVAENEVLTIWPAAWGLEAFAPEAWVLSIASSGVVPTVILVEASDTDDRLLLTTDQPLAAGVEYTMTPPPGVLLGGATPTGGNFVAKSVTRTEQPDLDLLDIEAPPFEPWRITPGGDHGMAAGFITFRKLVIGTLLTVRGSVPWAPGHGSDLPHKGPRPLDLAGEESRIRDILVRIPGMLSVGVALTWDGQQLVADVDARGDAGSLQEEVRL